MKESLAAARETGVQFPVGEETFIVFAKIKYEWKGKQQSRLIKYNICKETVEYGERNAKELC